jgi:acetyltransferase-like isoleucine patch superfamily enzyme
VSAAVIGEDTRLGRGTVVGPFAVLGMEPDGLGPLFIGDGSTIRSHAVVYRGTTIGAAFHAGHGALIREHTTIGDHVSVGSHTIVEHHVVLGGGVRLHSRCFVPEFSVVEEGAWLGPGVIVTNARYPNRPETKENLEGVHVGAAAVLGAGSVLLPGVRIGARALVGAGAVVVRDVPEGATVVGNPGRILP